MPSENCVLQTDLSANSGPASEDIRNGIRVLSSCHQRFDGDFTGLIGKHGGAPTLAVLWFCSPIVREQSPARVNEGAKAGQVRVEQLSDTHQFGRRPKFGRDVEHFNVLPTRDKQQTGHLLPLLGVAGAANPRYANPAME